MSLIYKPKGRAAEYGEYAFNPFIGCRYDCIYCYNRAIHNRFFKSKYGNEFDKPIIKPNMIEQLKKEAPKYKGKEVFMSFSTDPFQGIKEFDKITEQALNIFLNNSISVRFLTKSNYPNFLDEYIDEKDWIKYGATLTYFTCGDVKFQMEPRAASNYDRWLALKHCHEWGIYTWVSLEPVIRPSESLELIRHTHTFVDEYKVGMWHYSPEAKKIDWKRFGNEAVELLEKYGKKYYIKEDLKREMVK